METLDFDRIHKFQFDDLRILIDINSGSLHVIDEMTWDFLDLLADKPWQDALEALAERYDRTEAENLAAEVQQLIANGQLFSDDAEIQSYVPHTEPLVKAICLHMAHEMCIRDSPSI